MNDDMICDPPSNQQYFPIILAGYLPQFQHGLLREKQWILVIGAQLPPKPKIPILQKLKYEPDHDKLSLRFQHQACFKLSDHLDLHPSKALTFQR